jgi:hypothetical protein
MIDDITHRTADSFQYHREVKLMTGVLDAALDWCRSECRGDWRWRLIDVSSDWAPGQYEFYFDNDVDACAFVLKWS